MADKGASRSDPERLAHFKVLGRLGQGGMGVVYRAEDEKLRRQVALKVLPEAMAKDEERRRRFLREARSAAAITHPNIATVYEVDEADGRVFIAMELVDGPTLRTRVAKGALKVSDVVRIGRGIARGLARAHARGVVHRDVKPDNVMLDEDGEPKILDFGLAKLRDEAQPSGKSLLESAETESKITAEGRLLGTPGYMAPEQVRAKPVDARTDVFALGIVLYEMCAGEVPFRGESNMDVMMAIVRDPHPPLRERNPDVPEALAAVVDKCLAKSPDDRWATAREVAEALEGIAISADARVPAAPAALPSTKSLGASVVSEDRGRPPRWALLALGAIALAVVAGALVWRSRAPIPPEASGAASGASVRADAAAHGIALTDWPPPKTSSPEAATEFAQAMELLRDASMGPSRTHLLRALQLDPNFAAAHMMLGWIPGPTLEKTREELAAAAHLRSQLDDTRAAVLDVLQGAFVSATPFGEEHLPQWRALADRYPDDATIIATEAVMLLNVAHESEGLKLMARSLELDPKFALAEWAIGNYWQNVGNLDGAAAAADRCLAISRMASDCLQVRAQVAQRLGQCGKLEDTARAMITLDPRDPDAYGWLAAALAARNAPIESISEAAARSSEYQPDPQVKEVAQLVLPLVQTRLDGNFALAKTFFPRLDAYAATQTSDARVVWFFQLEANTLYETGETDRALALADAFMKRLPVLTRESPDQGRDMVLRVRRWAGRIPDEEFRRTREEWARDAMSQDPPKYANGEWFAFYAAPAATSVDAREALDALTSKFSPLPPYEGDPTSEQLMGRVLLLAGRIDEAIPHLRRAMSACFNPDIVPVHEWAGESLGEALEAKGDKEGACAAFAEVLAHWGNAKPRSVTADKARAHMKTLGCAK